MSISKNMHRKRASTIDVVPPMSLQINCDWWLEAGILSETIEQEVCFESICCLRIKKQVIGNYNIKFLQIRLAFNLFRMVLSLKGGLVTEVRIINSAGLMEQVCNVGCLPRSLRQKFHKFKACLGYRASSSPIWAT